MKDRERKIKTLIETVPPVIRPVFGKDACVLAARVGRQLLHEVGIEATPLPVRAAIYNRAMATRIGEDVERLLLPWSREEELAAQAEGCWSVMIGWVEDGDEEAKRHRFVGHVILTTVNPDGIIDLTLDQADRPHLGIHTEPDFLPIDRQGLRKLRSGEGGAGYMDPETGTHVVYGYAEDLERKLRLAPDWSGDSMNQLIRDKTIVECRKDFRRKLGLAR